MEVFVKVWGFELVVREEGQKSAHGRHDSCRPTIADILTDGSNESGR